MNKSKKLLSVFLAVLMIMSFTSLFASAAETLTYSNVETWPTVTYKNPDGKMYFGQTLEQGLIINDDEVVRDSNGNQVEGYFVFSDPTKIPSTVGENSKEPVIFVPTDTNKYSSFTVTKLRCKVYFNLAKTTIVYDRENDPVVASDVEAGATLSTAILSGGNVVNPYNAEEPNLLAAEWTWVSPNTIVLESGYYDAIIDPVGYNTLTEQVYVKVAGDALPTKIIEIPLVTLVYDANRTWADVEVVGAKAVEEGTDNEVAGTFAITGKTGIVKVGTHEVTITFTPTDTNKYNSSAKTITIKVEKSPICFTDNIGNKIVPELTMPYGTKLDDNFARTLAEYVNIGENVWIYYRDIDGNEYDYSGTTPGLGTHTYKVTAIPYNPSTSNYKATELEFKLTIEPFEVTPNLTARGNDKYMITTGDYKISPRGSYDLYVDGELAIEDIKHQEEFTWRPEKSGTYDLKAVYTPIENDTYKVNDAVREDYVKNLTWEINCTNCTARAYAYGEKAMVSHMLGDKFAGWVFYDENGNEFTPENMEEYSSYVYFTMPDFSFSVRAKIVGEADDSVDNDDNSGSGNIGSTSIFSRFIEFLRNLFEKYINIFKTVFGMFAPAN